MVQKHHAWKARESDIYLYGEDIYDVHGIAYEPVVERTTFHAIALRSGDGAFATFADAEAYATHREPPVVPILFRGRFCSVGETSAFMEQAHDEPSMLGGEREGGFPVEEFQDNVCDPRPHRPRARATNTGPGTGGRAGSRRVTRNGILSFREMLSLKMVCQVEALGVG